MELPLIHPITVHFPIALYFFELFLILLWFFKSDEPFRDFAFLTFRLAFLSMIAAVIAGLVDTGGFSGIQGMVKPHFSGAVVLFVIQILRGLYWVGKKPHTRGEALICLAGALLGCAAVIYTGYYGGEMVYSKD